MTCRLRVKKTHLTDGSEQLTLLDVGGALIESRQKPSRRTVFKVWRILAEELQMRSQSKLFYTHEDVTISGRNDLIEHSKNVIIIIDVRWIGCGSDKNEVVLYEVHYM